MSQSNETEDLWSWFNDLTQSHPEAEIYRPSLDRIRSAGMEVISSFEREAIEARQEAMAAKEAEQRSGSLLQERFRMFLVEMTTSAFDKQATYTTAILSIGYVGLFTAWNLTAPLIATTASRLVLVTALLSLVVFIIFEVFKMVYGHYFLMRTLKAVGAQGADFDVERQKYLDALSKAQPWFYTTWALALSLTLALGLASASILVYAHIEKAFFPALS